MLIAATIILAVHAFAGAALGGPVQLQRCRVNDPELGKCLTDAFNTVIRSAGNGSEEYGVKPLEPLRVPFLEFGLGAGNVSAHIRLRDVAIQGLSRVNVTTVRANPLEVKLEVTAKIPGLLIAGHYLMEGGVLSLPLYSDGPFSINASDVLVILICYYKTVDDHLAVDTLTIDMIPSDIEYFLGGFLDGENVLGEAFNQFLNQNSHEVFTALKPPVMKVIGKIVWDVIDEALLKFPLHRVMATA